MYHNIIFSKNVKSYGGKIFYILISKKIVKLGKNKLNQGENFFFFFFHELFIPFWYPNTPRNFIVRNDCKNTTLDLA